MVTTEITRAPGAATGALFVRLALGAGRDCTMSWRSIVSALSADGTASTPYVETVTVTTADPGEAARTEVTTNESAAGFAFGGASPSFFVGDRGGTLERAQESRNFSNEHNIVSRNCYDNIIDTLSNSKSGALSFDVTRQNGEVRHASASGNWRIKFAREHTDYDENNEFVSSSKTATDVETIIEWDGGTLKTTTVNHVGDQTETTETATDDIQNIVKLYDAAADTDITVYDPPSSEGWLDEWGHESAYRDRKTVSISIS